MGDLKTESNDLVDIQNNQTMNFCSFHHDAVYPTRATTHSAGYDLACLETVDITPGKIHLVRTGVGCLLPENYYGLLALRSGWASRNHCVITAGIIDRDYKGEIFVAVSTIGRDPVHLKQGTKFAQIIPQRTLGSCTTTHEFIDFEDHPGNKSQHDGFGSTGK